MAVIYLNGTMDTIEVDVRDSDPELFDESIKNAWVGTSGGAEANHGGIINTWCSYTVDKNGVYTLQIAKDQSKENVMDKSVTIDLKHITRKDNGTGYVVGNDDTVYLNVDVETIKTSDSVTADIIYDVDSVTTGVKNVNIEVSDKTAGYNTGVYKPLYEIYTLYDGRYITGVVVMGEDQGVSSDYAYVTSDDVIREDYDSASEEWTWSREVVINGELTEITYVGDKIDVIDPGTTNKGTTDDQMDQGYWYKVSYYADGTVKGTEALNKYFVSGSDYSQTGDEFIENPEFIEDSFDNGKFETGVFWYDAQKGDELSYKNGSMFVTVDQKNGISVHPDVKVVVANADGKGYEFDTVEDGYTGYDGLKDALDDLNANEPFEGQVSAILENGMATSIIINCTAPDKGFNAGDTETNARYEVANIAAYEFTDGKYGMEITLNTTVRADDEVTMKVYTQNKDSGSGYGRVGIETPIAEGTDSYRVLSKLDGNTGYRFNAGTYNVYVVLTVNGEQMEDSEVFEVVIPAP